MTTSGLLHALHHAQAELRDAPTDGWGTASEQVAGVIG